MKLGVRAHDYGRHTASGLAEILGLEGYEAVQLAVPKAILGAEGYGELAGTEMEEIRTAFQESQIEISVLGCYIDLGCTDMGMRMKQIEQFGHALHCGKQLCAGMVGTESSYGIIPMEEKKKTWELVADSMERIMEDAERLGVIVGIEPVAAHTLYCAEWTARLLDRIGSAKLKVIFDPVNLLTVHTIKQQEQVWDECFEAFGDAIEVVHLKDFKLREDGVFEPCLLGEGLMKYDWMFQWLHQNKEAIPILREEMMPRTAHGDIRFMKILLNQ